MTSRISRFEQHLWPEGFKRDVWMMVDAARDARIMPILRELHLEHYCLYSGPLPPQLEIAAPYLLQLDYDDENTRRFLTHAWDKSWGVFLKCGAHVNTLRGHLRGFLLVRDPDGNRLMFRYYDPRVLRVYLPTCQEEELHSVFGPIERFWIESQTTENMLEYRVTRGKLVQRTLALAPGAQQPGSGSDLQTSEAPRTEAPHRRGLLTIRQEQIAVFSQSEVEKFEEWMLAHLREFFPVQCRAAGESRLREIIRSGIERAASYRITVRRDVCKYIDLMVVFGRAFDQDNRYPWAGQILAGRGLPAQKMRNLFAAAQKHLRES